MRISWIANAASLVLLWIGSAAVWSQLPERIPAHIGFDGRPDRWVSPTFFDWFGLPLVALGITAMLVVLGALLPQHPSWFNMPHKERFLALPRTSQAPVIQRMQDLLAWIGTQTVLLFGFIQVEIYRTSRQASAPWAILVVVCIAVFAIPISTFWLLGRIQAEVERQSPRTAARER